MNTTLYGEVEGHELREGLFVSFKWSGTYSHEPRTFDYPGSTSWDCEEVTDAKVFPDYDCEGGRNATEEEKEEMRQFVDDWELQDVLELCNNEFERN